MSDHVVFIYSTFPNAQIAEEISRTLVSERLIACANILAGAKSIYRWNDQIQTESEVSAIFKTTPARQLRAIGRIKALHPYQCPCLAEIPLGFINTEFAQWVQNEV